MGLVNIITKVTGKLKPPCDRKKPEQFFYELEIDGGQVRIPEGRYQLRVAIKMIPYWSRNQVRITGNAFGRIARELQLAPEKTPVPGARAILKYSAADIVQVIKRAEGRRLIQDPAPQAIPEYLPVDGVHDNIHGIEIYIPGVYYTPVEACRLLSRISSNKLLLTPAAFGRTVTRMGLKDPSHHGHDEIVAYTRTDSVNKHEITCYRYSARAIMEIFFQADKDGLLKSYEDELAKASRSRKRKP